MFSFPGFLTHHFLLVFFLLLCLLFSVFFINLSLSVFKCQCSIRPHPCCLNVLFSVTSFRLLHSSLLYESSLTSLETINYSPLSLPKTCYLCHSEMLPMLHYVCLLASLFCEKTIGPVVVNSVCYQNKVYIPLCGGR